MSDDLINPPNRSFIVDAVRACLGTCYLVGGAVRDTLLTGDYSGDFDFATSLEPDNVAQLLKNNGYKVIDNSKKYGTIASIIANTKVEITTFRNESYTPGSRKPHVQFSSNLEDDLARRDFTINAIAHDGEHYLDPFGGRQDIISRKIRAVGDPTQRFEEDPLRIFRAIRFVSTLGFNIEPETYDAMEKSCSLLAQVSRERLSSEFDKIVTGENWVRALALAIELDTPSYIFGIVIPNEYIDTFLEQLESFRAEGLRKDLHFRWGAITSAILDATKNNAYNKYNPLFLGDLMKYLQQHLRWSNDFTEHVHAYVLASQRHRSLKSYEQQLSHVSPDDEGKFIIQERILKLKVKESFANGNIDETSHLAKQLLSQQTTTFRINEKNIAHKSDLIKEVLPHILWAYTYALMSDVYDYGTIKTSLDLNAFTEKFLKSKNKYFDTPFKLSPYDEALAIEECVFKLAKVSPGRYDGLNKGEVVENNKYIPKTTDRLKRAKRFYISQLIDLRHPPFVSDVASRRANLNVKIANLIFETNGGIKDKQYFSHNIDFYKWKALAAEDLLQFWDYFEHMNEAMDSFTLIEPISADDFYPGHYLDNAQCLIHALNLESNLEEKIDLTLSIINNFTLSSGLHKRNADRFRVVYHWYNLVRLILDSKPADISAIVNYIINMPTYNYVDTDEDYLEERLPTIIEFRNNVRECLNFMMSMSGTSVVEESMGTTPASILNLYKIGLIAEDVAFNFYKKTLSLTISQNTSIEPLSLLDTSYEGILAAPKNSENDFLLDIIEGGESDTVEFKESWRYDISEKQINKELERAVLKNIAAFMNTRGGKLFLGVSDSGSLMGLEQSDFVLFAKKNLTTSQLKDEVKKQIDNVMRSAIGTAISTKINISFFNVDNKTICVLDIPELKEPVLYNDKFYVRNSASANELMLSEALDYIKSRSL